MPDLKLIYYPNEILERECETVTSVTDEIILFAEEMANLMYKNGGVGLAANQVGDNRRLILVDAMYSHTKKFDLKVLINPEITNKHGEVTVREGCLSFPGITARVTRAKDIAVKALDVEGNIINFDATHILSVCIQHEIDHLNGITFFEHIPKLSRRLATDKLNNTKKKIFRAIKRAKKNEQSL